MFLDRVLAPLQDGEYYVVVGLRNAGSNLTEQANSIEELNKIAEAWDQSLYCDVYMALATFKSDKHACRQGIYARRFKSLWLDLDVAKDKGASYSDLAAAKQGLSDFLKATGLKPTILVHSGKGLHVYFTLTHAVDVDTWYEMACRLKTCCMEKGLLFDQVCTADRARVLRVVGTTHHKSGNPVKILLESPEDRDPIALLEQLRQLAPVVNMRKLMTAASSAQIDPELAALLKDAEPFSVSPDADAELIVQNCRQMAEMGHGSEPVWHAGLCLLKCCHNGEEWAHKLSSLDVDRYDPDQTQAKFDSVTRAAVHCQTFDDNNPGICDHCPHRGGVTSPVQLGYIRYTTTVSDVDVEVPFVNSAADPYIVKDDGVYYNDIDKQGKIVSTKILPHKLVFYQVGWSAGNAGDHDYSLLFHYYRSDNSVDSIECVLSNLGAPTSWEKWTYSVGLVALQAANQPHVVNFMKSYVAQIMRNVDQYRIDKEDSFGWHRVPHPATKQLCDGLVLCGQAVTAGGLTRIIHTFDENSPLNKVFTQAGTLEEWKSLPRVYTQLDQKLAQFAICLAFAAPLFHFIGGEAKNCMLNIWSASGGHGKTTLLRVCSSVWGNPRFSLIQQNTSATTRGRYLAAYRNLPCCMDEITFLGEDELNNLVFLAVGGKEKQKQTQTCEIRNTGDWETAIITSANKPVKDNLRKILGDSDAGIKRIMDCECDFPIYNTQSHPAEVQMLQQAGITLEKNYGLAGPVFIQNLLSNPLLLERLPFEIASWITTRSFDTNERYYSNPIALAVWAGRQACQQGLLDFDMNALENWVEVVLLANLRKDDEELNRSEIDILFDYLNDTFVTSTLIVQAKKRADNKSTVLTFDPYIIKEPKFALAARVAVKERFIVFSLSHFKTYCDNIKVSFKRIKNVLLDQGVIEKPHAGGTYRLGSNVDKYPSIPVKCYKLTDFYTKRLFADHFSVWEKEDTMRFDEAAKILDKIDPVKEEAEEEVKDEVQEEVKEEVKVRKRRKKEEQAEPVQSAPVQDETAQLLRKLTEAVTKQVAAIHGMQEQIAHVVRLMQDRPVQAAPAQTKEEPLVAAAVEEPDFSTFTKEQAKAYLQELKVKMSAAPDPEAFKNRVRPVVTKLMNIMKEKN